MLFLVKHVKCCLSVISSDIIKARNENICLSVILLGIITKLIQYFDECWI